MKRLIYTILLPLLVVGCNKDNDLLQDDPRARIYLSAVTEPSVVTRTPYEYITPNENPEGILMATVLASTTPNQFLNTGDNGKGSDGTVDGVVSIHAMTEFDNGAPQLLSQAVYPIDGKTVYFVGFHPMQGWVVPGSTAPDIDPVNGGKLATFTFNGTHDVMFAPRIEGTYATSGDQINTAALTFKHLLTWFKLKVSAEDEKVNNAWGKIKSIKITSLDKVSIDISSNYDAVNSVTFSGEGDTQFNFYQKGSDVVFPSAGGYELEHHPVEVAYVLCAPVDAKAPYFESGEEIFPAEYVMTIETEHRMVTLPIDLKKDATNYFAENTRGRCFTINLKFTMGNTVVVTATVSDWGFGGTGNAEFGE